MTKEELQKIIAIDEGFRIELTKSKGEVETIQNDPDTMQKSIQKDAAAHKCCGAGGQHR